MKKYFLFLLIGLLFCSWNAQAAIPLPIEPAVQTEKQSILLDYMYMKDVTVEELKELIDKGENPRVVDVHGITPLHVVSGRNRKQGVLETLIIYGANVNAQDEAGWTPLMFAVLRGDSKAVKTLIKYGADVNVKAIKGHTALHIAVSDMSIIGASLNFEIIKLLILQGADVNAKTLKNWTPLRQAMNTINPRAVEAVELLLKYGADVKIKYERGLTALDCYRSNGAVKKHPKYWDVLDLMYQKMKEK